MTRPQKYQWRLLRAIPGNHRWFIDELSGGIACADDSGKTPDETDDGVLWLNQPRYILLAESGGQRHITTPVISERTGENSVIGSTIAELLYLMRAHKMELRIEAGEDDGEHFTV